MKSIGTNIMLWLAKAALCSACLLPLPCLGNAAAPECRVSGMRIGGYVGERIATCVEQRVKKENVSELIDIFRHRNETSRWQSEFFGKWIQGAVASYQYTKDPELLELIRSSAEEFMETQSEDGYIGNYTPEAQLSVWDIWGRKYSALGLIAYYRLTGDSRALDAATRLVDHLIAQLRERNVDIARTGYYLGMASCSVLEPVVYLYELTGGERFLDFARTIVSSIEQEGCAQIVSKALEGVPVSRRAPLPANWWSYDNGMKAYEMMSCYVGLMELGRVLGEPRYLEAARRTADSIRSDEINVAGSGASFECWYGGRALQTAPAYHTMETCVTFTYMQLSSCLFAETGDPVYVEDFERTMYNALIGSMKHDGSEISKYSPLEGRRVSGEEQCGMHINCCNANGPRGFALIPQMALTSRSDTVSVNLYLPLEAELETGAGSGAVLRMDADIPVSGDVSIVLTSDVPQDFTLGLRVPQYALGTSVSINGQVMDIADAGQVGYIYIDRSWSSGDRIDLHMDITTKVLTQDLMQAVVRGPVVFARDSRFSDGDVDECLVIRTDGDGNVDAAVRENDGFAWLTLEVPAVLGTDLENPENGAVRTVRFCDFSSAGNDWASDGRYRVWLPRTLNVKTDPYVKY